MTDLVHPVDDAATSETSPQVVRIDRHAHSEPVDGASPVRGRHAIRRMLERHPLTPGDLSLPVLVTESADHLDGTPPTVSLHGLPLLVRQAHDLELRSIKLFAGGDARDDRASDAASRSSLMVRAIAAAKDTASDLAVMTENCLCAYTADGNCFLTTTDGHLDYSATLERLASQAVVQADAGADVLGPAAMLEGLTAAVRAALDGTGHRAVALMPHVIFASRLYSGYRRAMQATPRTGNRAAFQVHPSRPDQAIDYSLRCLHEQADMLLLEPALFTVDVLIRLRATTNAPLFPFSVSGEYALLARTDNLGRDRDTVLVEYLTMLKRAGAEGIITYAALDVARHLDRTGGDGS
jgi:porphobilinogen synthase